MGNNARFEFLLPKLLFSLFGGRSPHLSLVLLTRDPLLHSLAFSRFRSYPCGVFVNGGSRSMPLFRVEMFIHAIVRAPS